MVAYNDPYFPTVGRGRHYDLNMTNTPLDNLGQYDAVVIVTDHSNYDYKPSWSSRSWWSTRATPPRGSTRRRSCAAKGRYSTLTEPREPADPAPKPIVYLDRVIVAWCNHDESR